MSSTPYKISRPPEPTLRNPYAQVIWIFYQVEREYDEPTAANYRWAKNSFLKYLEETYANSKSSEDRGRFYLHEQWGTDALVRFCDWLGMRLTSKTRYSLYKCVRKVMDFAYALRVIDTAVYSPGVFKGTRETNSRSAYSEDEQEVINAALAKWLGLAASVVAGYARSGKGVPYKKRNFGSIKIDGAVVEISDAASLYNLSHQKLTTRLQQGWTVRETLGLDERGNCDAGIAQPLEVEGQIYQSIAEAAKAYGVPAGTVALRLRVGGTPEQAVGIVPTRVLQSDERALLWAFENDYECDAEAMLTHFNRRKLGVVCTQERLRALFSRWGVWAHVDDRLVMPLATELCVLTGLNVEALKQLEVDSYQDEHGLTGEPVIAYRKPRSGSATRSEDQSLHIGLLETEEVFVPGEIAKRVKTLINLILAITLRIRHHAPPELSRRLFIFEDVEQSRKAGQKVILGIDPKGKVITWGNRFKREEGLLIHFGKEFSFNISRCRPTLATNMVLAGASLLQVQATLGHRSIVTSASYLDEHQLQPAFNREVTSAMERIVRRSNEHRNGTAQEKQVKTESNGSQTGFSETLSGCGCSDPYAPSERVQALTKYKKGSACKFWNMCLFCDQAIVTESSLPKIIVYRKRLSEAVAGDSPAIRPRIGLFNDVITLIDGILKEDVIFPKPVIEEARDKAVALDDVLVDQLIYQGI